MPHDPAPANEGYPVVIETMLGGMRALDLTDERGFMCGKYLAMLGVEVIKVERPGGDATRSLPPTAPTSDGGQASLYWAAFNAGKRSITIDIDTERGQHLVRDLAKDVDFVVESFRPGFLARRGLDYASLREVNPTLVMASISDFGQEGPRSNFLGSELVDVAMSGVLSNTGYPDRAPVKEALDSAFFHSGIVATLGALLGKHHVLTGGQGQHVDVSIQEVAASRTTSSLLSWQFDRKLKKRAGGNATFGPVGSAMFWRCKDGFVFWYMLGGKIGAGPNAAMSAWMSEYLPEHPFSHIQDWAKFDKAGITVEESEQWDAAIQDFFLKFTKDEIRRESMARRVNATVVNEPADVLADPHLAERGFWQKVNDPAIGAMSLPKYMFHASATNNASTRPAPLLGEANDDVLGGWLGLTPDEIEDLRSADVI